MLGVAGVGSTGVSLGWIFSFVDQYDDRGGPMGRRGRAETWSGLDVFGAGMFSTSSPSITEMSGTLLRSSMIAFYKAACRGVDLGRSSVSMSSEPLFMFLE